MPESIRILCPNCGRRLALEPHRHEVTCKHCGQRSRVGPSQPAGADAGPSPSMVASSPSAGAGGPAPRTRGRTGLWIALALLAAGATLFGAVIWPRISAPEAPPGPASLFEDASPIPRGLTRKLGFPVLVERVVIYERHADVDAAGSERGEVERIRVRLDRVLRRGAGQHTAVPFDVSEIDFKLVPVLVAEARRALGDPAARPLRVVIERDDEGAIRWRVHLGAGGEKSTHDFDVKGRPLAP